MTSEIKPTAFKNGVPKEQKNGFFGIEESLLNDPQTPITVIATVRVADIIDKELSGERYPIVEWDHLEPIFGADAIAAAKELQQAAYKVRTSGDQLPIDDEAHADEAAADEPGDGTEETDDELVSAGWDITTDGPEGERDEDEPAAEAIPFMAPTPDYAAQD